MVSISSNTLERFFRAAEQEFLRIVNGAPKLPFGNDLLHYSHLRKRWEAGQRIVASEVVQLNVSRKEFADETTTALYRKWIAGTATDQDVVSSQATSVARSLGLFRAEKWGGSLSVFIRGNQESSEIWSEKSCEPFSP